MTRGQQAPVRAYIHKVHPVHISLNAVIILESVKLHSHVLVGSKVHDVVIAVCKSILPASFVNVGCVAASVVNKDGVRGEHGTQTQRVKGFHVEVVVVAVIQLDALGFGVVVPAKLGAQLIGLTQVHQVHHVLVARLTADAELHQRYVRVCRRFADLEAGVQVPGVVEDLKVRRQHPSLLVVVEDLQVQHLRASGVTHKALVHCGGQAFRVLRHDCSICTSAFGWA